MDRVDSNLFSEEIFALWDYCQSLIHAIDLYWSHLQGVVFDSFYSFTTCVFPNTILLAPS